MTATPLNIVPSGTMRKKSAKNPVDCSIAVKFGQLRAYKITQSPSKFELNVAYMTLSSKTWVSPSHVSGFPIMYGVLPKRARFLTNDTNVVLEMLDEVEKIS